MILSGTTTTVNFFVADSDGLPATGKASSISAALSINGGQATAISDTITEIDSTNLPGWYRFNHQFSTAGNVFITFSCTGCNITPWEESVVDIPTAAAVATAVDVAGALTSYGAAKASDIPTAAAIGAAVDVSSALTSYGAAKASDIPTAAAVATAVDVAGALTSYGAAKASDIPTAAAIGAAVDVSSALTSYGAAKASDIPTAAAIGAAVDVSSALTSYGAAKASDIPTAAAIGAAVDVSSALTSYGAAKASDIPTAAAIGAAVWTTEDRALSGFGVSAISNAVWTSVQIDFATSTQLYALENSITMKFNNLRADIPTAAENAAAALKLDVAAAQGEAAALSLATLILSQFNSSIDTDGRWTVYKTDGTVQTQRQVSTSDNAEPVTGIGELEA